MVCIGISGQCRNKVFASRAGLFAITEWGFERTVSKGGTNAEDVVDLAILAMRAGGIRFWSVVISTSTAVVVVSLVQ